MPEKNQCEKQLTAALRELAALSSQGASPELGLMLKDAFRRHHSRRRRLRRMSIAMMCVCAAVLAAFLSKRPLNNDGAQTALVRTIPPEQVIAQADVSAARVMRPQPAARTRTPVRTVATSEFVALPSLVMVPAGDELRVIRLEMPGEDLRLVGAPVTEEITRRRVTADFLVGHDGTPYAVRLVNSKF